MVIWLVNAWFLPWLVNENGHSTILDPDARSNILKFSSIIVCYLNLQVEGIQFRCCNILNFLNVELQIKVFIQMHTLS